MSPNRLRGLAFEVLLRIPDPLRAGVQALLEGHKYRQWIAQGRPAGPLPAKVKREALRQAAIANDLEYFVETGTYLGDMTYSLRRQFAVIHTIELSERLYQAAKRRFKGVDTIRVWYGDSGAILHTLLPDIEERTLFWLDAHYSGGITAHAPDSDTPIMKELNAIAATQPPQFAILIDDARHFTGDRAYPTVEQVADYVEDHFPSHTLSVDRDLIKILPRD